MGTLNVDTLANLAGTGPATLTGQATVKTWTSLNGTGTIAARDDYNVASYTDNGTGDYTATIANDMADGNYYWSGAAERNGGGANDQVVCTDDGAKPAAGSLRFESHNQVGTILDSAIVTACMMGDLA
jgi:hypothetical protein